MHCFSDFQLQMRSSSPRILPQLIETEPFGELTSFEEMMADDTLFPDCRRTKRKKDNPDLDLEIPAKLTKQLECITEPLDIPNPADD